MSNVLDEVTKTFNFSYHNLKLKFSNINIFILYCFIICLYNFILIRNIKIYYFTVLSESLEAIEELLFYIFNGDLGDVLIVILPSDKSLNHFS